MKKIGRIGLIFCVLISISVMPVNADVTEAVVGSTTKLAENAKSVIMLEASTGKVLYERNANEKLAPASMTKMMSLLLIMESIEQGIIRLDEMVTVSENASSMGDRKSVV